MIWKFDMTVRVHIKRIFIFTDKVSTPYSKITVLQCFKRDLFAIRMMITTIRMSR